MFYVIVGRSKKKKSFLRRDVLPRSFRRPRTAPTMVAVHGKYINYLLFSTSTAKGTPLEEMEKKTKTTPAGCARGLTMTKNCAGSMRAMSTAGVRWLQSRRCPRDSNRCTFDGLGTIQLTCADLSKTATIRVEPPPPLSEGVTDR